MLPHPDFEVVSQELVGYTRMKLNESKGFIFKPTERLQLILGTNGSGKSSMMGELSPLPPKPSDFEDGGYKRVVYKHAGHTYCLTSTKNGSSMRHSFVKDDGEDMNPGGTAAVQKELVWQEFGLTQEIHDLIIGKEQFTKMGPGRRREWFTKLSEVSYDFAIAVYNKMKERLRDTNGAIKIQKKYLVEETRKLVPETQLAELTEKQSQLQTILSGLFSISKPNEGTQKAERLLTNALGELESLNKKLGPVLKGLQEGPLFLDRNTTEEAIEIHQGRYTKYSALVETHSNELEEASKKYELLMQRGQETLQSLSLQAAEIEERTEMLKVKYKTPIRDFLSGSTEAAQSNFNQVKDELAAVLNEIPANIDGEYSRAKLDGAEHLITRSKAEITQRENRAEVLRGHITQAKCQHKDGTVTCPSCEHSWSLSDTSKQIEQYEHELESVVHPEIMSRLEQQIAEATDIVVLNRNYAELYTRLHHALRTLNTNYFGEFISQHFSIEDCKKTPKVIAVRVHDVDHDLTLAVEEAALAARMDEIIKLIAISRDTESYNADDLKAKIDKLHNLIFEYNGYIVVANKTVQDLRQHLSRLSAIDRSEEQYDALFKAAEQAASDVVLAKLNSSIWEKINDTQIALAMVTEKITNASMQQNIIDDITRRITTLENEKSLLDQMVSHMSPTEGLIADGLMGFIRTYVKQMNNLIRKVWVYPLVIQTDLKEDIDFKFPMMVQHRNRKPVDDVSEGSSGMQEIVNLAFRIVGMKYLGLGGYPLMLDEFASSMDEAHKSNVTDMIKSLLDQENFSQLFMVSHDHHQYGALSNPQVCVICSTNITIPEGMVVNEHVSFM